MELSVPQIQVVPRALSRRVYAPAGLNSDSGENGSFGQHVAFKDLVGELVDESVRFFGQRELLAYLVSFFILVAVIAIGEVDLVFTLRIPAWLLAPLARMGVHR